MAVTVKKNNHTVNSKKAGAKNAQKKSAKPAAGNITTALKKIAKITKLPQNVRDTIPIEGFIKDGIIETEKGVFTKSYPVHNVNFSIAPDDEQLGIFHAFMDLLNSFPERSTWEFTIFNHKIDKRKTIEDIRIKPQPDGLNRYRQDMNQILLKNLKEGNNSITQERYLTVSVEDRSVDHAIKTFNGLDEQISQKLRKICKVDTKPYTEQERMQILYNIYNQDTDYRFATGIYDGKEKFELAYLEKLGLSIKDTFGPSSAYFDSDYFMLGDTYGKAMYLCHVPTYLTTQFIQDLTDIQCNMLVSATEEGMKSDKAAALVKSRIADIEGQAAKIQKRNGQDGVFGALPPELERSQENARELMKDITSRNQKLFFCTVTVVIFANTKEKLLENEKLVRSVSGKHIAPIKPLRFQQEFGLNTALPLCRNDLYVERMYTTEQVSVFIPYTTQEISQKHAIFYGTNQISKSMVLYDRLTGQNYNSLIFGASGSGKSFIAKFEMINVLLSQPDSQVFVIDPQGEYFPLASSLDGERIILSPGSGQYMNPLDLDISEDASHEDDPIAEKVDFIISMFDIITGKNYMLSPEQTSILDKATRFIYKSYIEYLHENGITSDPDRCPTLTDLYNRLMEMAAEQYAAKALADQLYQYACGTFDTFAHRTNIDTHKKFIVYDIKSLGTGMKELGLFVSTNDVYVRMKRNSANRIKTWFYIDEFHILLQSAQTTTFLKTLWKVCRKWLGCPCGIMQNTEDLLRDADTRNIINNTSFMIILKEPLMDRQNLQALLKLSDAQLDYITDSDAGSGLIYNGKTKVPFKLNFPKDSSLYRIMTTAHDVSDAEFK